ncbi:MAG: hypothetical protein IBX64_13690 [Actinobacteria bacterium]|nr:hypothetical protein [Actinomycetota bacterium]
MRVTGGAAGGTPERPLEKGVENIEERVEAGKQGLSRRLDRIAVQVDRAGTSVINKTSNWERIAFSAISNSIRVGADYIQSLEIDKQLDRAATGIRKNPPQALLIALGIGLLLGFIVRRR